MPDYKSITESRFFIDNFTHEEISYAESGSDKKKIFTTIFAIKEALIKCDNELINLNFNQINIKFINHLPKYKKYKISTSSSGKLIIAVVIG